MSDVEEQKKLETAPEEEPTTYNIQPHDTILKVKWEFKFGGDE